MVGCFPLRDDGAMETIATMYLMMPFHELASLLKDERARNNVLMDVQENVQSCGKGVRILEIKTAARDAARDAALRLEKNTMSRGSGC